MIIANSSNEHCNALQVKNAFYLAASNASKLIQEWAAHSGLSVSPSSVKNIRVLLIKNQKRQNFTLGHTKVLNLAYDNCDFKFGVGQPTDLNDRTFESITTGLFINAPKSVLPKHLKYDDAIWERHPNNENLTNPLPPMTPADILPSHPALQKLQAHCQWHVKALLIEEYLGEFKSNLGNPPSTFTLDAEKTSYSTAEAMHAKALTTDGNIEALTSLLEQSGIIDAGVFEKYMILVHGDLGALEKMETILHSRHIEDSTMEHMHYLLPIPGLFHVRMACMDAINRIYATSNDLCADPNGLYK